MRGPGVLLLACVACAATVIASGQRATPLRPADQLFSAVPLGQACAPASAIPTAGLNLTAEEQELLQFICWPEAGAEEAGERLVRGTRRGIPPGVECKAVTWCDGDVCTEVCDAGSVAVEAWLHNAIKAQTRLAGQLPFCYTTVLGTHNSGITLAAGYGNLDPYFQDFFKYIKWAVSDFSDATLRTNDQWLSVTDQLNLGVRALELDTHWVGGALRVAHCGGFHVEPLNQLIKAINLVAKLLHRHVRWDTETFGCMPSLSSIPALEQRKTVEVLAEVKAWMDQPENADEFVIIYFDDQPDLMSWGVEEHLQLDIRSVFPAEEVFSTDDHAAYQAAHGPGAWPSMGDMVAAGKRLLFVSGADYGDAMRPLVFSRSATVCGWSEPNLDHVEGLPQCVVNAAGGGRGEYDPPRPPAPLFDGTLFRVISCELEYGPLNCDFVFRGSNEPYLDEATMPAVLGCGLNMPSPDLLTPSKAAAAVWTWAPGHPYEAAPSGGASGGKGAAAGGQARLVGDLQEANCAVISAADGRWRAASCEQALPSACRMAAAAAGGPGLSAAGGGSGTLLPSQWALSVEGAARGACPEGSFFDIPRHPLDGYRLASLLQERGVAAAWLPLAGPGWELPDPPAAATGAAAAA